MRNPRDDDRLIWEMYSHVTEQMVAQPDAFAIGDKVEGHVPWRAKNPTGPTFTKGRVVRTDSGDGTVDIETWDKDAKKSTVLKSIDISTLSPIDGKSSRWTRRPPITYSRGEDKTLRPGSEAMWNSMKVRIVSIKPSTSGSGNVAEITYYDPNAANNADSKDFKPGEKVAFTSRRGDTSEAEFIGMNSTQDKYQLKLPNGTPSAVALDQVSKFAGSPDTAITKPDVPLSELKPVGKTGMQKFQSGMAAAGSFGAALRQGAAGGI